MYKIYNKRIIIQMRFYTEINSLKVEYFVNQKFI